MTLCGVYVHLIEEKVSEKYKAYHKRNYNQKINQANTISMTKNNLVLVFFRKQFTKRLQKFDQVVEKTKEIVRPGQSNHRNIKSKRTYSINYKRL